jgi:phosphomannomutase
MSNSPNGEWITFTGDQLGTLFASHIVQVRRSTGKSLSTFHLSVSWNVVLRVIMYILDKLAMVASAVSSKMIETIAEVEGFKFKECLTGEFCSLSLFKPLTFLGFKYIGNTALDLVTQGFEVPFGYEEAIGYMFGSEIRDKDGIAATVRRLSFYGRHVQPYGIFRYYLRNSLCLFTIKVKRPTPISENCTNGMPTLKGHAFMADYLPLVMVTLRYYSSLCISETYTSLILP